MKALLDAKFCKNDEFKNQDLVSLKTFYINLLVACSNLQQMQLQSADTVNSKVKII